MVRSRQPLKRDSKGILHLPTEILSEIAKSLNKRDCHNLAVTCKTLQPAAESVIWRTVAIDYDCRNGDSTDKFDYRIKRKRRYLAKRPHRMAAVRRLDIKLYPAVTIQLIGLVIDVWRRMETLSISVERDLDDVAAAFKNMKPSMSLRKLEFYGDVTDSALLAQICRSAPELRSLSLHLYNTKSRLQTGPLAKPNEWSHLCPNLKDARLDFDFKLANWAMQLVVHAGTVIIENSMELNFHLPFSADGKKQCWFPKNARRLILYTLEDEVEDFCEKSNGVDFESVEEFVTMNSHLYGWDDCNLEFVDIPAFPRLRAIQAPVRTITNVPKDLYSLSNPNRPLHTTVASRILQAPSLEIVYFGEPGQFNIDYNIKGWCSRGVSGCIIRTYVYQTDTLIHVRKLENVQGRRDRIKGKTYSVSDSDIEYLDPPLSPIAKCLGRKCRRHEWQDFVSFKGNTVDEDTLKKFYTAQKATQQWTSPGRGLPMRPAAWDILSNWYTTESPDGKPPYSLREMRSMRREGWEDLPSGSEFYEEEEDSEQEHNYYDLREDWPPGPWW